jgi:PAT family beta-lactamase induction signal transducer AmpG
LDLRRKLFWIAVLYFAEGFPYGLFKDLFPVYFRYHGVSLADIGLLSLLSLPWTLKVFWAPVVDRYGNLRSWIGTMLLGCAAVCVVFPSFDPSNPGRLIWGALLVLTICSATQDIAIDAMTIRMLDKGEEGPANGVRLTSYRIAILVGGGALASTAGFLGWTFVFWASAVVLVGCSLFAFRAPVTPRPEIVPGSNGIVLVGLGLLAAVLLARFLGVEIPNPLVGIRALGLSPGAEVLAIAGFLLGIITLLTILGSTFVRRKGLFTGSWVARREAPVLVIFVLLYRIGDFAIGPMIRPFWVDAGFRPEELFTVTTTVGVGFTILGVLSGGWVVRRIGLLKSLWVLGIAQTAVNLSYASVAALGLQAAGGERFGFYAASMVESYGMGLGNAALLALLMRACGKNNAATEYALLSAIYGFSAAIAGSFSGWACLAVGYPTFFAATFVISQPVLLLLLLPSMRSWVGVEEKPA